MESLLLAAAFGVIWVAIEAWRYAGHRHRYEQIHPTSDPYSLWRIINDE
jgi:hypothetical protein